MIGPDFAPSEAVALGRALEELANRPGRPPENAGKLPALGKGDTRDKVGAAVAWQRSATQ